MKKILSIALLLGSFVALNAQTIDFLYDGNVYHNGDTMVVTVEKTAHTTDAIGFRNGGLSDVTGLVVNMTEIERDGIEAWGLCTGDQCVPTLTSATFTIPAGSDYNTFTIDITVDDIARPYGVYNMVLSNNTITSAIVVRFQAYTEGIENVAINNINAYPNPAQGQVNISYSVDQPSTLAIYDMQGRMVRQENIMGNGTAIVNDLHTGVYVYGIMGQQMQKLIVK